MDRGGLYVGEVHFFKEFGGIFHDVGDTDFFDDLLMSDKVGKIADEEHRGGFFVECEEGEKVVAPGLVIGGEVGIGQVALHDLKVDDLLKAFGLEPQDKEEPKELVFIFTNIECV